jgi:uncharacterized protein GlcG (DUF336 family)
MFTSMSAARTGNVTGARYRRPGLAGQDAFAGRIYYAATDLEARQCRGREVVVAGGIPLTVSGVVVGAVGVSGGSGEQDQAVAEAAAVCS